MDDKIERHMTEAFEGGARLQRELRLLSTEIAYVIGHYPVRVIPMGSGWYEITFLGRV